MTTDRQWQESGQESGDRPSPSPAERTQRSRGRHQSRNSESVTFSHEASPHVPSVFSSNSFHEAHAIACSVLLVLLSHEREINSNVSARTCSFRNYCNITRFHFRQENDALTQTTECLETFIISPKLGNVVAADEWVHWYSGLEGWKKEKRRALCSKQRSGRASSAY